MSRIEKDLGFTPERVQSSLGGAFLRMYLDGKKDRETIAAAANAIAEDGQFQDLIKELNNFIQSQVNQSRAGKAQTDKIRVIADHHLKAIKAKKGIAFRRHLNTIIGGVGGIAVDSATCAGDISSNSETASKYRLNIHISDTYHFNNHRTGGQDRYRKELARYLIAGNFGKFEEAYNREATLGVDRVPHIFLNRKTSLDNATVFASFMYALEMKNWTHGLAWDVVVPAEITLVFKHAHKTPGH